MEEYCCNCVDGSHCEGKSCKCANHTIPKDSRLCGNCKHRNCVFTEKNLRHSITTRRGALAQKARDKKQREVEGRIRIETGVADEESDYVEELAIDVPRSKEMAVSETKKKKTRAKKARAKKAKTNSDLSVQMQEMAETLGDKMDLMSDVLTEIRDLLIGKQEESESNTSSEESPSASSKKRKAIEKKSTKKKTELHLIY